MKSGETLLQSALDVINNKTDNNGYYNNLGASNKRSNCGQTFPERIVNLVMMPEKNLNITAWKEFNFMNSQSEIVQHKPVSFNECQSSQCLNEDVCDIIATKNNAINATNEIVSLPVISKINSQSKPIKKRKQSTKKKEKGTSFREENKKLRALGQQYKVLKKDTSERNGYVFVTRKERSLKPRTCKHRDVLTKRSFMCGRIDETTRRNLFNYFWKLQTWGEKRAFLNSLVYFREPLRRRKDSEEIKKQCGYDCYLPDSRGIQVRVCREFLLLTLDLRTFTFNKWLKSSKCKEDGSNTNDEGKAVKQEVIIDREESADKICIESV